MIGLSTLGLGSAVIVGALVGAAAGDQPAKGDKPPKKEAPPLYEGFKADQALLRKTVVHEVKGGRKDTVRASSPEACQAARRIFERVSFLFRTRAEVLELLGDPATISDYNDPVGKDPSSPLVYVFDTGLGGLKYTISFAKGDPCKANQVRVESLD